MSNWFIFHHINRQTGLKGKKKKNITYVFISLLIIIAGSWLINNLLKSRGLDPLQISQIAHQNNFIIENFSPSVLYWHDEIEKWAGSWGLDPQLIATVMQIESCGDPRAVSTAGAQGLFQVMPYHFQPGEDMLDSQTNARRGLSYLHAALQIAEGDVKLALAGYNGGHSQIHRDSTDWPAETRRYVHWGTGIYQDAVLGNMHANTLSAWLRAGGWQLCEQAEINLDLR